MTALDPTPPTTLDSDDVYFSGPVPAPARRSPLDHPPQCAATIIWEGTHAGWRQARWHASVISSDVPDELRQEARS